VLWLRWGRVGDALGLRWYALGRVVVAFGSVGARWGCVGSRWFGRVEARWGGVRTRSGALGLRWDALGGALGLHSHALVRVGVALGLVVQFLKCSTSFPGGNQVSGLARA